MKIQQRQASVPHPVSNTSLHPPLLGAMVPNMPDSSPSASIQDSLWSDDDFSTFLNSDSYGDNDYFNDSDNADNGGATPAEEDEPAKADEMNDTDSTSPWLSFGSGDVSFSDRVKFSAAGDDEGDLFELMFQLEGRRFPKTTDLGPDSPARKFKQSISADSYWQEDLQGDESTDPETRSDSGVIATAASPPQIDTTTAATIEGPEDKMTDRQQSVGVVIDPSAHVETERQQPADAVLQSSTTKKTTKRKRSASSDGDDQTPSAKKTPKLKFDYEKRYVLQLLFTDTFTTKERARIFNHIFDVELTALGQQGTYSYSKMSQQNGEKKRKDRSPPEDWLRIVAKAADDDERDLRAAIKVKVDGAAKALRITLTS